MKHKDCLVKASDIGRGIVAEVNIIDTSLSCQDTVLSWLHLWHN